MFHISKDNISVYANILQLIDWDTLYLPTGWKNFVFIGN